MKSEKIKEEVQGAHIYMRLSIDGKIEEIDAYISADGFKYRTTGDDCGNREKIISAFNVLF
jgi:hypothetical protein